MPDNLSYSVSLDSSGYTRPMSECVAEVKKLGAASKAVPTDGMAGMGEGVSSARAKLEKLKESLGMVPKQLDQVTAAADKSSAALSRISNIAIGTVVGGLADVTGKASEKLAEMSEKTQGAGPKMAAALGTASVAMQVLKDGQEAYADAVGIIGPKGAAAYAVVAAAYKGVDRVGRSILATQQEAIDHLVEIDALAASHAKRRADDEKDAVAAHNESVAAKEALTIEHMEHLENVAREHAKNDQKRAEDAAAAAEQSAERIAAARERGYATKLSPQADLERQISAQKAAGPSGQAAVDAAAATAKEGIYLRTVLIWELEKKLSDLKAADAKTAADTLEKAQQLAAATAATADAAERKAAADRAATAMAAKDFKGDNAILLARSMGDEKQAKALERAAAVEQTKRRLEDQGASPAAAADQAERRQNLEEMVADRAKNPRRIRTLTPEQSAARRALSPAMRGTTAQLRKRAISAAAAHHADPPGGGKDHGEAMSKKLDTLELILKKLENVGSA